jgi:hypothetical protein
MPNSVDDLIYDQNYIAALQRAEQKLLVNPDNIAEEFKLYYCAAWCFYQAEDFDRANSFIQFASSAKFIGEISKDCPCVTGGGEANPSYAVWVKYLQHLVNAGSALKKADYQAAHNECEQATELDLNDSESVDLGLLCSAQQYLRDRKKGELLSIIYRMKDGLELEDSPEDEVYGQLQWKVEFQSKLLLAQVYMSDERYQAAKVALSESQQALWQLKELIGVAIPSDTASELCADLLSAHKDLHEERFAAIIALVQECDEELAAKSSAAVEAAAAPAAEDAAPSGHVANPAAFLSLGVRGSSFSPYGSSHPISGGGGAAANPPAP